VWAFGLHLVLVAGAASVARLPFAFVCRRLAFEAPFVLCALLLPFTGGADGTWAAWNVLAKATLGTLAVVVLGATTPVADLLRGLEVLRVPRAFTSVAGFMARYADVVTGEVKRMRIAQRSRAYDPRWLWHARALAPATGALFVRSFERGERVYVSMLSRGFDGSLPRRDPAPATPPQWLASLAFPAVAALIAVGAST
jgi:cobalt/nickel transport system permease protein